MCGEAAHSVLTATHTHISLCVRSADRGHPYPRLTHKHAFTPFPDRRVMGKRHMETASRFFRRFLLKILILNGFIIRRIEGKGARVSGTGTGEGMYCVCLSDCLCRIECMMLQIPSPNWICIPFSILSASFPTVLSGRESSWPHLLLRSEND